MSRSWAEVSTDVLTHYVPAVLAPDRRYGRIRELITSAGYLDQKLLRVGILAVLDDLRTARRLAPGPAAAGELAALETALSEAAQILQLQPEQLRGQLLARIPRPAAADLAALLDEAAGWRDGTWWRPYGIVHNHGYLASLGPVSGMVDAIAVSDDGSVLLSGSRAGELQAWDLARREQIWSSSAGYAVNAIAFRPGSFEAFVGLDDGIVARWSPGDRRLRRYEELEEYAVAALAVGDEMLVYSGGPEVRGGCTGADGAVWRSSAGQSLVTAVAITGDGKRCVSGARDGSLVLWRLSDGRELRRFPPPVDRVLCLAALPGTGTVVVGGKDKRVIAVDVDTGATRTLGRHRNQVRSAAAFDGRRVVTGSYDGQVLIWEVGSATSRRIGAHNGWCLAVAAPRGGGPVATGSGDGRLRLWDPAGTPPETDRKRHTRSLIVADGIAYGGTNRAVHRIDARTGAPLAPLTGHRGNVEALVATAYGVASGSGDKTIRRWDPALGRPLVLRGHEGGVRALAVTPDGTEIVSVSGDRTWRRWDARTGAAGPVGQGTEQYNSVLVLSPDGQLIVTATIEHTIEVWQRESGRAMAVLSGHTGYVESLIVTPGNDLLVSGSWDRTLRVWDLAGGRPPWTLSCDDWIVDLAADGDLIAAYCANGTVILVDPAARTVRGTLELGGPDYGRLALRAGCLFALRSYELQAWDLTTGVRLATFDADLPLRRLALAGPDTVVVGTELGTLVTMRLERSQNKRQGERAPCHF